jgi:hypothetical protein
MRLGAFFFRNIKHKRSSAMGKPPPRAIEARRLNITDELKANIRHRFEHTPESLSTMAADLGCTGQTVCNIAKREGWVRYVPPPRDLTPEMRLLARAGKLAEQDAAAVSLPPRSGGEGRPTELAEQAKADGVGGFDGVQEPPTPDPSPPFAARIGGGDENAARAAQELSPEQIADTAEALHAAARKLLADVEASRAQLAGMPQSPIDQERTARTYANLTATLQKLAPLRCRVAHSESHTDHDYDDMPADLDEFRRDLARRIDAFVASRMDPGAAGDDGSGSAAAASS